MGDKHNAGPWTVEPLQITHGADMAICAPGVGVIAVIQHDPDIQDCEEPDGETVKWHPADLANALVISEAPAMLGALRWALDALDKCPPPKPSRRKGDLDNVAARAWHARASAEIRAILARVDAGGLAPYHWRGGDLCARGEG